MIPYKQLSLADIFQDCQNIFDHDKPAFLSLLETHIDIDEFIPITFRNHFYASTELLLPKIIQSMRTALSDSLRLMQKLRALINPMIPTKLPMAPCLLTHLQIRRLNSYTSTGISVMPLNLVSLPTGLESLGISLFITKTLRLPILTLPLERNRIHRMKTSLSMIPGF